MTPQKSPPLPRPASTSSGLSADVTAGREANFRCGRSGRPRMRIAPRASQHRIQRGPAPGSARGSMRPGERGAGGAGPCSCCRGGSPPTRSRDACLLSLAGGDCSWAAPPSSEPPIHWGQDSGVPGGGLGSGWGGQQTEGVWGDNTPQLSPSPPVRIVDGAWRWWGTGGVLICLGSQRGWGHVGQVTLGGPRS